MLFQKSNDFFSQFTRHEIKMGECCTYIDEKDDKEYFVRPFIYQGEGKTIEEATKRMEYQIERGCKQVIGDAASEYCKPISDYTWSDLIRANGGSSCQVLLGQNYAVIYNKRVAKKREALVCYELDNQGQMQFPRLDNPWCVWQELALFCPYPEIFTLVKIRK